MTHPAPAASAPAPAAAAPALAAAAPAPAPAAAAADGCSYSLQSTTKFPANHPCANNSQVGQETAERRGNQCSDVYNLMFGKKIIFLNFSGIM